MAKILITGGAGFIGSNLADRLLAAGHEVSVVDDLSSGRRDYLAPDVRFYQEDICSPDLDKVFAAGGFDYVYHLAAQIDVRKSVADPVADNRINVLGGLNVIENCRRHGVKKVIMASTGGAIYGEAEEIPTPESYPTYPLSPYGIHKLTLEKYLNYYHEVFGLNYAVLRFANVYGPRQYKGGEAGVIAIFIANAVAGQESLQFGDGLQTRDFVYVDDVVSGLEKAMAIDCRGEINIASGNESSLLDVRQAIAEALGSEPLVKEMPAKLGEQRRSCLSNRRAREVLDWEPQVGLKEGIKRTIEWTRTR